MPGIADDLGARPPDPAASAGRALLRTGAVWALGAHGVNGLAWLATTAVVSRALAPAAFGAYLALVTTVVLGACLGRLGTDRAVVHRTAAARAAGDAPAARAVAADVRRTAAAGGAVVALMVLSPLGAVGLEQLTDRPSWALRLGLAAWLLAEVLRLPLVETLRAWSRVRAAAVLGEALRAVAILVAVSVVAVAAGPGAASLAAMVVASAVATSGAALVARVAVALVTRRADATGPEAPGAPVRADAPAGRGWTVLADGSAQVLAQGDVWIAAAVLGPTAAGEYGAAVRLALLPALILPVASAAFAPLAAHLDAVGDRAGLQDAARHVARLAAGAALAVVVAYLVGGRWLLGTLFGSEVESALPVLLWLSLGQLVNAAAGPCGMLLLVTGRQRAAATLFAVVAGVLVVLGPLAAEVGGAAGLAVASGAATATVNALLARRAWRATGARTDVLAGTDRSVEGVRRAGRGV